MSVEDKKRIVAQVNFQNKTYFKYLVKSDMVFEEFNRSAKPLSWMEWYAIYR